MTTQARGLTDVPKKAHGRVRLMHPACAIRDISITTFGRQEICTSDSGPFAVDRIDSMSHDTITTVFDPSSGEVSAAQPCIEYSTAS